MDKELKKLGKYLHKTYPQIHWYISRPEDNIVVSFGDGFILAGVFESKKVEFFILDEDKNKEKWGDIVAAKLIGTETEDAN